MDKERCTLGLVSLGVMREIGKVYKPFHCTPTVSVYRVSHLMGENLLLT